jgi:hypothetical protein
MPANAMAQPPARAEAPARRPPGAAVTPPRLPAPALARRNPPSDALAGILSRCCAARGQAVLQRMHVDGATCPKAVCQSFARLAKVAANPYRTTFLNLFGIGDSEVVQSDRLSRLCREWLEQFAANPADHSRYAKLDFVTHDVEWPLPTTTETWAQLRTLVEGWRSAAEVDYEQYSEIAEKNRPDVEDYEQQVKLAWAGASGAFPI